MRNVVAAGSLAGRSAIGVVVGYIGLLSVAGTLRLRRLRRLRRPTDRDPARLYAVLVPAHNEERLIRSSLASMGQLRDRAGPVQVHVVADNCSDGTAQAVRDAGFQAHERNDPEHGGKGPALRWLIDRLAGRGELGDVVVFVDADTTVDPGFLRAVDAELDAGADAVQGNYAVRDPGDSPVVAFRAAAMAARNYLRPLGRNAIGGSAGLYGNGMAFPVGVLDRVRWSDHLTEDVELHLELLLDGTKVAFAPDARVEAEMPDTLDAAATQHERWERGRLELARRYVPVLLRQAVTGGRAGRVAALDAALDLLVPPLSVVAVATTSWTFVAGAGVLFRGGRRAQRELVLALGATTVLAAHVLLALLLTGAPRSTYRALVQAPRMIVWKLSLWQRVLRRGRSVTWTRTTRNVEPRS